MTEVLGRPPHEPTEKTRLLVTELTAFGITQEKVAHRLDISVDTLARHYRSELNNAKTNAVHQVATGLFDKAINGDIAAQMFYLKTQGRWREKDPEEDTASKALSLAEQILKLQSEKNDK
jgi:hypothetical protein